MSGVEIPVTAKLNDGDLDAELAKLTEKINRLGQSIASANKVKFNPITRATLDDLQRITAQFEAIKRASPNFAQRVAASGQANTPFVDLDWSRMIQSAVAREAQRYGIFTKVMAGTGAGFSPLTPSSPGAGSGGSTPPRPPVPPGPGASWGAAGRRIVGSGLRAAGPVGGVADSALSAGLTGGITAGIAGLLGGIVALGISKAVGAVANKAGDVARDDIGYDTLKRMLGDVNVSFGLLRDSLHAAAGAVEATYADVQKLGTEFAHVSGISGDLSKTLAEEVRVGGGFGRSFGIDPSQSVEFFARLRQFGVTHNDGDSRRMALTIGEAIARSGAFSKSDEILRAIENYTAQQTRLGLTAANASGYAGALAGMVGSGIAGLDPQGAANLLGQANTAIQHGGNAGEAGQFFTYMALGRQMHLNPIESRMLQEQGAFGTGASTFGSGTLFSRWAHANGVVIPDAAHSTQTNLAALTQAFRRQYAVPWLRVDAMANYFGVGVNQAMALDVLSPKQLGGLASALQTSGVDLKKMSANGISAMAQIASGDRGTLNEQVRALWPQLNKDEERQLDTAAAGGDESLRKTLLQLVATHGQEQTDGDKTRQLMTDASNKAQDAAGKMVHSLDTIRDTLLYAFGNHGSMTAADMHKAVVDAQRKAVNDRADERITKARAQYQATAVGGGIGVMTKEQQAALDASYKHMQDETAAANKDRATQLAAIDAGEASPGASGGSNTDPLPAWASSGGTPGTSSAARARASRNARNHNPGNIRAGKWATAHGAIGADNAGFAIFADDQTGTAATDALLLDYQKAGIDTIGGIVAKWAPSSENDTQAYAARLAKEAGIGVNDRIDLLHNAKLRHVIGQGIARIEGSADSYRLGTPLPAEGNAKTGGDQSVSKQVISHEHVVTLQYPNGQPAAPQIKVGTSVPQPTPFGSSS